jgi:hypothetical protein
LKLKEISIKLYKTLEKGQKLLLTVLTVSLLKDAVSFINADKTKGAIITLNCETDFVGKMNL